MKTTDEVFRSVIQKRNEYESTERNDFMKNKAEKPKIFRRIVNVAACAVVAVTVIALALSPFIFRDGNNTVDPGTVGDGSKAEESLPAVDSSKAEESLPAVDKDIVVNDYYHPDYDSTSTLHFDEFIETLKRDGYYAGGVNYRNYNTNNIDHVYNITPKSISDETDELEIFYVKDACHCFMMYKGTIYRYDTIVGQLCLWDYDENGTKDLFSYYIWGSGLCYQTVSVTDLSTMTSTTLMQKNVINLDDLFEFEIKDGVIYIEGRELTFDDGRFSCGELSD